MKKRVKKTAGGHMCHRLLSNSAAAGLLPVCRLISVLMCVMLAVFSQAAVALAADGYDKVAGKSSMRAGTSGGGHCAGGQRRTDDRRRRG